MQESWVQPLGWVGPLEKEMQPTPVLLSGEFHGQRSLVGYSLWGRKELDMTERLTLYRYFKCLSVRWTFGLFHLLTFVSSAALDACVQVFVWTLVFSASEDIPIYPRVALVGHMVIIWK